MARPKLKCTGHSKDGEWFEWEQRVLLLGDGHMFAVKYDGTPFIIGQNQGLKCNRKGRLQNIVNSAMRSRWPELVGTKFIPEQVCSEDSCVNPEHHTTHRMKMQKSQRYAWLKKMAAKT
jgi:hypothetical protein